MTDKMYPRIFPNIAGHINTIKNKSNSKIEMKEGRFLLSNDQTLLIKHDPEKNETIYEINNKVRDNDK